MEPASIQFDKQEDGEAVLRVVRRHWFNVFVQYIPLLFTVVIMIAAAIAAPLFFPEFWKTSPEIFWFFETILALIVWVYAALLYVDYFLDVWIVTDRRVVNIEQKGLFIREISELRYNKIQDVTTEVEGFFPTILDYGEVFVQTAGEKPRFLFHNVPDPNGIKAMLMDLQKKMHRSDIGEVKKILAGAGE